MKYGALVDFAFEKWLLPGLFGDGSDGLPAETSWKDALGALLAGKACLVDESCCEMFGAQVSSLTPQLTKETVRAACDELILHGAQYLREKLTTLDATSSNLNLATKSPCAVFDDTGDGKADGFGTAAVPCVWAATWLVGGEAFSPAATFVGERFQQGLGSSPPASVVRLPGDNYTWATHECS
ncbi:MAG: hypothetical protein FJ087_02045 [Deltaproteobacteria bacterium]|nr:hypothetical protein [Deltaproteobacteria bacterium]